MATKTAKKELVFTKAEVEEKRREMIEKVYGVKPAGVDEGGYQYDVIESIDAIIKVKEKEKKKS